MIHIVTEDNVDYCRILKYKSVNTTEPVNQYVNCSNEKVQYKDNNAKYYRPFQSTSV